MVQNGMCARLKKNARCSGQVHDPKPENVEKGENSGGAMQMILAKIPYLIPNEKCVLIPESALANIHAKFELRK